MKSNIALLFFGFSMVIFTTNAQKRSPSDEFHPSYSVVKQSPFSKLAEVPMQNVDLTDGFWKVRLDQVTEHTVPEMFEYMKADSSSLWRNFLIVSGEMEGKWNGEFWHDGDFYKWFEAFVYTNQVGGIKSEVARKNDKLMDEIIDIIGKVQQPDGYISTYIQSHKLERFQNKQHHELYNMGHLMTAAARHFEATGKTSFLNIGKKTADYLYNTFAVNRPSRLNPFCFNPSNIMGAMDMYRATGDKRYIALADAFVSMRGTTKRGKTITEEEYKKHSNPPGEDNNQDRVPFREETVAVGHAVTGTYLYAGAADLYMETGEKALLDANNRIWDNVVQRKLLIHGGASPLPNGTSVRGDKVHEAFDAPYSMPMQASYNETCSNIGNVMWTWRMYKTNPDVKYLDIMETGIYNSGLSGIGLDGFSFYYNNPLRRFKKGVGGLGGWNESFQRSPHIKCYCCPPQLARHIAGFRHYLYSTSPDKPELWVNFFASGVVTATLNDGTKVSLTQTTEYPWKGDVAISIGVDKPATFAIKIPVPGWAAGTKASVNGEAVDGVVAGNFISLERKWKKNDQITLSMPMNVRLMKANPLAEEARNQITVMRGPVVYCLESTDLPEGVNFMDVVLKKSAKYIAEFKPGLLGGVCVIKTKGLAISDEEWSENPARSVHLYKETGKEKTKEIDIQLIPYYAWSNRGLSEMTVWIPATE